MTTSATSVVAQMTKSKFLAGIPEHDQQLILGVAERRQFSANEVIIRSGDQALRLFLLSEGTAKYYRETESGDELLLWWVTPGDVFGLATLLENPPGYIGSAEATKDCTVFVWEHASIRNLSGVYPQLSENALRITLGYLAAYAERHAGITTKSAEERLAHTLLRLGHSAGRSHPNGVDVDITNEQLGGLADVGLFTTSRLLSNWERQGTIVKTRGKISIQSPEKLLT